MINLSIKTFFPFLIPSDLNPVPTEQWSTSQRTKTALVNNILNILRLFLQGKMS